MNEPIPLINVTKQNEALSAEIFAAIKKVVDSAAFILGPEVKEFEQEFKQYTQVKHAISCASGSDALLLPLMAIGVGPGDEVIVPSFTFYATAGAVARLGATPIFVDSDETYNLSLKDVEAKISAKTKAIIPVHLFGQMVDMPALQAIVRSNSKNKITLIEDCAQSIGAQFNGQQAGTFGEFGAYSFYPTKNLGAMGDAGMMSAREDEGADKLQMIRVHGSKQRYYHELVGVNSRLDSIQAAILRIKLRELSKYEAKRTALAEHYSKCFREAHIENIQLPVVKENRKHVWNQYTIRAHQRDALRQYLSDQKIGSEIYYPLAMHKQKAFLQGKTQQTLALCEKLEAEVLSLPMFPELELSKVERVVDAIATFYKKHSV